MQKNFLLLGGDIVSFVLALGFTWYGLQEALAKTAIKATAGGLGDADLADDVPGAARLRLMAIAIAVQAVETLRLPKRATHEQLAEFDEPHPPTGLDHDEIEVQHDSGNGTRTSRLIWRLVVAVILVGVQRGDVHHRRQGHGRDPRDRADDRADDAEDPPSGSR